MRVLLFVMSVALAGCSVNTVYVPDGKSVRLRQDVKAKVWALDSNGNPVPGKMVLKEGWFVVPPPSEDK